MTEPVRGFRSSVGGLLLLPLPLLLACGAGGASADRDSLELREWTLEEELRIGSLDDPDQALTRVGAMLPLPDGGVWVLQPADRQIREYAADGSLVRRIGRSGEGPGEFASPGRMGWWRGTRDTVWVSDGRLKRVSLFTREGVHVRSIAFTPAEVAEFLAVGAPAAFAPDGSAIGRADYQWGAGLWGDFPIVRYSLDDGRIERELARVDRTGRVQIHWQGQPLAEGTRPVSDAPIVAYGDEGDRIIVVDRTVPREADDAAVVRIVALDPAGDTLWERSYPYEPRDLPRVDIESILAPRIESFQGFARLEGRVTDRQAEQAYRASQDVPARRPPIRGARVGTDGRIWLEWQGEPDEPGDWWILDADGEPEAVIRSEEPLSIRSAGEAVVWAVETDDFDVPYLVRYALSPTPSGAK